MAGKKKFEMTPELQDLLNEICKGTKTEAGFLFVDPGQVSVLVKEGFVEVNEVIKNESGAIGARATQKGMDAMTEVQNDVQEAPTNGAGFSLVSDVPMPEAKRKGGRQGSAYPFDKMEVGQSFFIPATTEKPEPWKQYASTVSSATQRYAEPVPGETRKKRSLVVDAEGKAILDEAGNKQYSYSEVQKTKPTRQFVIKQIADGTPWGKPGVPGAGVWRTA